MTQVVKAVEAELQGAAQAKLVLVRLKIRASSHLLAQDLSSLEMAFVLAAQGTRAEGAKLDVIPMSDDAWCPSCRKEVVAVESGVACCVCGGLVLTDHAVPEVLVHELVVEE